MMHKRLLMLLAVMLMIVSSAMAQVTTSSVSGRVKMNNNRGEDIIGATIVAVHVPTGTRYEATTNVKGAFSLKGLRAGGPYTVNVEYVGMQPKSFQNVNLELGEDYHINVVLISDAEHLNEVIVKGQAGRSSRTGATQSIKTPKFLQLPSVEHSISDIARINPFIRTLDDGTMIIAGTNNRYNNIMIDGAMSNDVFGLTSNGLNGGLTNTQPFSIETIEQIQMAIAPYDVRQGGFTGGSINATTKSGTNQFHGSVYGNYQSGGMVGKHYQLHDGSESPEYGSKTYYTYGATLGGPIIKNKLFFFANFERESKEFDNSYSTDNGMSQVDFGIAQSLLDYVKKQAPSYTGTLGTPTEYSYSDKVGLKLDWNIDGRNHASLRWSFVDSKKNNSTASANQLVTSDFAYDYISKTNSLVFQLNSRIGSHFNNAFHVSLVAVRDKRNPGDPFPMIQIANVGDGTLSIGNSSSAMANSVNQNIYTLTDNLSWSLGSHLITLGTHDELYTFDNLYCPNLYGSYYYSSPADFYAGNIQQFRYSQGVNEKLWSAKFSAGQLGFYIEDKWVALDNLELTYGVRMDMPFMCSAPAENKEFNEYAASQGWGLKTNQKISMTPLWSPRLGFNWTPLYDRSLIIRGGVGIFTGRSPYVWLSNNFSNTGIQQISYSVNPGTANVEIKQYYDPEQSVKNLPTSSATYPTQSKQTINVFNNKFKFSQVLRADLGIDFDGPFGTQWSIEGIYTKTLNDVIVKNYDITATGQTYDQVAGFQTGDNRPMYETSTVPYSGIYVLDNTSKGYSYNVAIKGKRSFDFGLDITASYTYGKSKSVNSGIASTAISNWQYNYTHQNPNDPELANSAYNIPHQVYVSAFEHIKWNKETTSTRDHETTIGLVYFGNSGSPYTVYTYGDLNGDGCIYNDLMYIPTDAEIDGMLAAGKFKATSSYSAEQQASNFKAWIAAEDYLKDHRGQYYERNAANEKWENRLDLHIDHKFGFKWGEELRYIQIGLDIVNFTNLLNKKWGATLTQEGSVYNYYTPLSYSNGSYQFLHSADYDMRTYQHYYSRWRMQLSARFIF